MSGLAEVLFSILLAGAGLVLGWFATPLTAPYAGVPSVRRRCAVALVSGCVFGAFGWRFGLSAALPAFLCVGIVGTLLVFIDLAVQRLPDRFTLPAYPVGAALLAVAAPFTTGGWTRLVHALLGMVALFLLYAIQYVIRPTAMGLGDVKLAGVLGLYLGWLGLSAWFVGTLLGFVLGGLASAGLLITRRASRKTNIPFGPFMLAGAFLAIMISA